MKVLEKYLMLLMVTGLLSAFAWYYWRDVAAPVIAAFCGIAFLTPLIMDVVPWLFQHQKRLALQKLNGVYYEYGACQVRILYATNLVWVVSDDLHKALRVPLTDIDRQRLQRGRRHCIIPGTALMGISEQNLREYVLSVRSDESGKFAEWFEKQVLPPIRTKVAQGLPIAESVRQP